MKIISKFKDYYDGCGYSTSAETGLYVRKTEEIPMRYVGNSYWIYDRKNCSHDFVPIVIGFCGTLHYAVQYKHNVIYSYQELIDVENELQLTGNGRYFRGFFTVDFKKYWFNGDVESIISLNGKYFSQMYNNVDRNIAQLFYTHRTPVFMITPARIKQKESHTLILNPCLKDLNFYKKVDAVTTYQEIEMFLNNQLVKPDAPYIKPIPDAIKAESKGFDKFSFRKDKTN